MRVMRTEKYLSKSLFFDNNYTEMYNNIQRAGFILVFREHSSKFLSVKKGNVDTDIVFSVMRKMYSLYRQIPAKYRDYLDKPEIKKKISL